MISSHPAHDPSWGAEDFVVRVEGALVLCAGTQDYGVFARTLKDLRRSVLERAG